MKSALALAAALFGTVVASPAFAQEGETPAAAPAPAEPAPAVTPTPEASIDSPAKTIKPGSIAVQFDLLPLGTYEVDSSLGSGSADTATAFAIGGQVNYDLGRTFSIGAAPRFILGVKPEKADHSFTELDLRARGTFHTPVAPNVEVLGFVEPGYGFLIPDEGESATGFLLALGGGVRADLNDSFFVTGELGYQFSFLSVSEGRDHADINVDYLHIGVGAGTRF
jgi:Outer membrane protein beta-barrel domain